MEIVASMFKSAIHRKANLKAGSFRWCGHEIVEKLLTAGKTVEEVVGICWLTSFGGVGVPVTFVSCVFRPY